MIKCIKGLKCNPTHKVLFDGDHYICSGVSRDSEYNSDNISVCINSIQGKRRLEMTEKEGLIIAEGILSAIYNFAYQNK